MRKVLFSLCFSLITLFLGIGLPSVPFPGELRLINLPWGIVYGAGLWILDRFVSLRQPSPVGLLYVFGWPIGALCASFFIGTKLYETNHYRLRRVSIWILIISSLAVMEVDRSLKPPFSNLPTFYRMLFTVY